MRLRPISTEVVRVKSRIQYNRSLRLFSACCVIECLLLRSPATARGIYTALDNRILLHLIHSDSCPSYVFLFFRGARSHTGSRTRRFEVSEWHKRTHTQTRAHKRTSGWTLWKCDQLVTEAAPYTTQKKNTRRTNIPWAGFETAIPTIKRLQIYILNKTITGIGPLYT